ncbi:bile acid:sodium symporter family protein [Flavobacterium lipolyticum]|uniref:Bile acid:sodium symporter family protein n=1 Tax=Flavobacterium lipolyticum TaxID=2893754 RepID=A0ABS8M5A8_9FLAO|nr:bile acid:sodium symporter family protein [Flavobacterium sp. F-126]MCC9020002.1 bile acid:sodium symporter family protein [Flavobacterium sp. F-126]
MEQNSLLTQLLPVALGIIMLGLGLNLKMDDFKNVIYYPKAILVGLLCQMILLPIICFCVSISFNLSPELAVGLILLAASPGGATANLYSHLAKGDVALNISLTAVNSVLTLFTLPFIVNKAIDVFMIDEQVIPMQFKKIVEIFIIVLVPVAIGMLINYRCPKNSRRMEKPVKAMSAVFLVLIIIGAIIKEKDQFLGYFQQVGLACLVFNIISMVIGYYTPLLLSINKKQSIAIGMEIGIHNGTLAIFIALNVIGNSVMSIPAAVYSLIMFFTAALFGYIVNRRRNTDSQN